MPAQNKQTLINTLGDGTHSSFRGIAAHNACVWHKRMGDERNPDKKQKAREQWLAWEALVLSPVKDSYTDEYLFKDE